MRPSFQQAIAALGDVLTPSTIQATAELLAPGAAVPDAAQGLQHHDQPYGPHPRHRLDLYGIHPDGPLRDILLFVHGGGFDGGDKGGANTPFYRNVGAWAAAHDMLGVIINYRLAPSHVWPCGHEDVIAVIHWLQQYAQRLGGNPRRIWLMGHSAGAAHVAATVGQFTRQARAHELAGALMLSGLYDPAVDIDHPGTLSYYGIRPRMRASHSSLHELAQARLPCLFACAQFDTPLFRQQATRVSEAFLIQQGQLPPLIDLPHHNHVSPVFVLGSADDDVGPQLMSFIRTGRLPSPSADEDEDMLDGLDIDALAGNNGF